MATDPPPVLAVDYLPVAEALAAGHARDELWTLLMGVDIRPLLFDAFRLQLEREQAEMIFNLGIPTAVCHGQT